MIHHAERLAKAHPDLVRVLVDVGAVADFDVLEVDRTVEQEREYIASGASKLTDPLDCLHVVQADGYSHAVDLAPFPIDWKDDRRFYFLGGLIMATARKLGVRLRYGGDWNGNLEVRDQSFFDLGHFEIPK